MKSDSSDNKQPTRANRLNELFNKAVSDDKVVDKDAWKDYCALSCDMTREEYDREMEHEDHPDTFGAITNVMERRRRQELKKLREVKDHLANGLIAIKAVASGHEHALDELGTVYRTARAFLSQVGIDA